MIECEENAMRSFQAAYLPIGVPTFHLESAQTEFEHSAELLRSLGNTAVPEEMLLSLDKLNAFLDTVDPDLLVIQNITFANAAYASEILHRFPDVPILLWTLREPVIDGGRLRLNSLTGAYSAANTIRQFRDGAFEYVYGAPGEKKVNAKIAATYRAAQLKLELQSLKIAAVGHKDDLVLPVLDPGLGIQCLEHLDLAVKRVVTDPDHILDFAEHGNAYHHERRLYPHIPERLKLFETRGGDVGTSCSLILHGTWSQTGTAFDHAGDLHADIFAGALDLVDVGLQLLKVDDQFRISGFLIHISPHFQTPIGAVSSGQHFDAVVDSLLSVITCLRIYQPGSAPHRPRWQKPVTASGSLLSRPLWHRVRGLLFQDVHPRLPWNYRT